MESNAEVFRAAWHTEKPGERVNAGLSRVYENMLEDSDVLQLSKELEEWNPNGDVTLAQFITVLGYRKIPQE